LKRKPSLSDPIGALGNRYATVSVRCVAQSIGIAKRRALLKDYRVEWPLSSGVHSKQKTRYAE
jgi:hypothetical protein